MSDATPDAVPVEGPVLLSAKSSMVQTAIIVVAAVAAVILMLGAQFVNSNRNFEAIQAQQRALQSFGIRSACLDDTESAYEAALAQLLVDATDPATASEDKAAERATILRKDALDLDKKAQAQFGCPKADVPDISN